MPRRDVGGSAGIYVANSGSNGNNFHGKGGVKMTYDGMQYPGNLGRRFSTRLHS